MTDREKIVSDEYYDLVTDYTAPPGISRLFDYVIQPVDGEIAVTYVYGKEISPINITEYTYPVLPKVYGLMQMEEGSGQGFDPTPLIYGESRRYKGRRWS